MMYFNNVTFLTFPVLFNCSFILLTTANPIVIKRGNNEFSKETFLLSQRPLNRTTFMKYVARMFYHETKRVLLEFNDTFINRSVPLERRSGCVVREAVAVSSFPS